MGRDHDHRSGPRARGGHGPDLVLNLAGGIPTGLLVAKKAIQLGIKAPLMQGLNFVVDSYPPLVPQAIEQSYFAGSKMMRSDRRQSDGATRCCVRNLHISKAPPRTTARTSRAARRSYARPAGSGVRVGCQLLGRFLDGLSLTSSLDGAKGLGALPKDIDAPSGHGSPPNCPSDHVENRYDDDGGSDGNECIEENAMSSS